MLKGVSGYVQADARVIYDALFHVPPAGGEEEPGEHGPSPIESGACRMRGGSTGKPRSADTR